MIRDDKGRYKFAKLSSDEKKLLPSDEKVGNSPPRATKTKDLRPLKSKQSKHDHGHKKEEEESSTLFVRHKRCRRRGGGGNSCGIKTDSVPSSPSPYEPSAVIPEDQNRRLTTSKSIGTLKNLVILLQFQDHKNRYLPSREDINILMNSEEIDQQVAPTGSLKMLYRQNSYGLLTIESEVTDWILLDNTEAYYAKGQSGMVTMFHDALSFALDVLEAKGFAFEDFDADGDNRIDSIVFLTSGYGAEWGKGTIPCCHNSYHSSNSRIIEFTYKNVLILDYIFVCLFYALVDSSGASYEDRIWSHKWSILGGWRSARTGVRVTDYSVSPSLWDVSGNEIGRIGVIAHGKFFLFMMALVIYYKLLH